MEAAAVSRTEAGTDAGRYRCLSCATVSRWSRRRRLAAGVIVVGLIAAGVAIAVLKPFGSGGGAGVENGTTTSLQAIQQRSLSSQTQVDGTLGYSGSYSVVNLATSSAPPHDSDVAAAQQQVTKAQADLDNANRGLQDLSATPTASNVLSAQQAVSAAQSQLDKAEATRANLSSSSAEAINTAADSVRKAQNDLVKAESTASGAAGDLYSAKDALVAEETAYCDLSPAPEPSFCPGGRPAPISSMDQRGLLAVKAAGTPADAATHAASVLIANTTFANAISASNDATAAVISAQGDLASAQNDLRQAQAGPSVSDVTSANADITAAQKALDTAKAQLADLYAGPTQGEQAAGQDSVAVAQAELDAARAKLASLYEGTDQTGQVTSLPDVGQVVKQGQILYGVDGSPVVLLYGPIPAYRDLAAGTNASDVTGADVKQLNADLVAMGYATTSELDPNSDQFSWATTQAVKKLQADLGVDQTGKLKLGSVVFLASEIRVTSVSATLGSPILAGATVLNATSTNPVVSVQLDPARQAQVKQGDKVTITLPDLSKTDGTVSSVGTVATAPASGGQGNQQSYIQVEIALTDPTAAGGLDQAPVLVAITTGTAENALVVPVTALLALAGGGYAVDVVSAAGVHTLMPVTLGLFDNSAGLVQVSGNGLSAGQQVVVPGR